MVRVLLLALCLLWPGLAAAQLASLVADKVSVDSEATIVAEGNVEILYKGSRLTATEVIYDQKADRLRIIGPLTLYDGEDTQILADEAELDPGLRNGVLRGARLVMNQQLQIASAQIDRVDGRYTQLSRSVASSCQICASHPTPLWEIRARRVIHDAEEQQLYFDEAQFRVLGIPLLYLPRMRLPDPTLDRATGFLVPKIATRSDLGTGLKFPYFLRLGDHADLTFTPYISGKTRTLETIYRQETKTGRFEINGAASQDDIRDGATRAYLFANGTFRLPRDFRLSFNIETVSDDSYLREYGYSSKDRLASDVKITRTRDNDNFLASATSFKTLRFSDIGIENELPDRLTEVSYTRRLAEDPRWGQLWMTFDTIALARQSNEPSRGRDVARVTGRLDWRHSLALRNGMVVSGEAGAALDLFGVDQDPAFASSGQRFTPTASVELRWPLERQNGRVRHLIEPVVQLAWTDTSGDRSPNEDSTVVDFDEGNLFSLSRYPGLDRYEQGLRANVGLNWTRFDPSGWSFGATVGRVYRFDAPLQFAQTTGLSGDVSDWLVAGHVRYGNRFQMTTRSLLDLDFNFSRSETRLAWQNRRAAVAATYVWLPAVPSEGRLQDSSEITFDSGYRFDEFWTGRFDWSYEADASRSTSAGLGLKYENECVGFDLSLSREFTQSSTVKPITDVTFLVYLNGFGTGNGANAAKRSCRG
jgi:LPS-assembly protein